MRCPGSGRGQESVEGQRPVSHTWIPNGCRVGWYVPVRPITPRRQWHSPGLTRTCRRGRWRIQQWRQGCAPEDWGAPGDTDWHALEQTFQPPAGATHGEVLLRSTDNAGTAWFKDVELWCDGEAVLFTDNADFGPDKKAAGWIVERSTQGEFDWDDGEGHTAPGVLRIRGTDSYNAFAAAEHFRRHANGAGAKIRVPAGYPAVV